VQYIVYAESSPARAQVCPITCIEGPCPPSLACHHHLLLLLLLGEAGWMVGVEGVDPSLPALRCRVRVFPQRTSSGVRQFGNHPAPALPLADGCLLGVVHFPGLFCLSAVYPSPATALRKCKKRVPDSGPSHVGKSSARLRHRRLCWRPCVSARPDSVQSASVPACQRANVAPSQKVVVVQQPWMLAATRA